MYLQKKMLCFMWIIILSLTCMINLHADLMIVTSRNGQPLNSEKLLTALNAFKDDAYLHNRNNGWGIVAFNQNGEPIPVILYQHVSGDTYTQTSSPYKYASSRDIYSDPKFSLTINSIANSSPYIVMVHARRATEAPYNVPDPFPLVWESQNKYYAFMHHGTITNTSSMDTYTNGISSTLYSTIQQQNNLNGVTFNSAKYFAYNMAHLMNKNYEFLHYFDAMMEHSSFTTNYADKSFVLCDGFQTFGYEDGDTMNFFSNMNSQNFQNPYIYTTKAGYINYGTSQAPILDLLESSGPYHVQYMPVNGRSTNYRFYLYNMMNRIMNSNITWHWESFPIMQSNPIPIASFTNTTKSYWQNTLSRPTDNYWYRDPSNNIWIRSGSYTFNFTNGHKLYVPTGISLQNEEIGNVIPQTSTVNISSGVKEWVGYWLMENQSLAQALGSHLSKVANVYGENWQYQDQSGNTKLDPAIIPTMNANSLIMEFGKMYIIELKQGESISNFTWQKGRINGSKNQCTQYPNYNYTEHFSYVQQANYETIMIDNIDETSGYE